MNVAKKILYALGLTAWTCGVAYAAPFDGVKKVDFGQWKDAYQISNSLVSLTIVPQIGRIMQYGFISGKNVLWTDVSVEVSALPDGLWRNYGGDKIWPWPRKLWGNRPDHFLPPQEWDSKPQNIEIIGDRAVRMTSRELLYSGQRVVRELRLSKEGTQVRMDAWLEGESKPDHKPISIWTVSQVRASRHLFVRFTEPRVAFSRDDEFAGRPVISYQSGNIAAFKSSGQRTKVNLDADAIGAWVGEELFVQQIVQPLEKSQWLPLTRTQIFWVGPRHASSTSDTYEELEFTSPTKECNGRGDQKRISLIWSILKVGPGEATHMEVANLFQSALQ